MVELTINEIIYETKGKTAGLKESLVITCVSTDTRTLKKGDLFVALSGENFNGEDFALAAIEKGAVAVVVSNGKNLPQDQVILVKDTQLALLKIAGIWRQKLSTKIVAITGSDGKTTTKDMLALIAEKAGKTFKTKDNLNNAIGLSQMLLQLDSSYDFAVLEVGIDGPKQMLPMAMAVAPSVAVITNIGESHLANFVSQRRLAKEKLTLMKGLYPEGTVVLNGDDRLQSGTGRGVKNVYFSLESLSAEVQGREIQVGRDATSFQLLHKNTVYPVTLSVIGAHNVANAVAAFSAAIALGIPPETAVQALEEYRSQGMRQKMIDYHGATIVEDCYNASPQSVKAALETLEKINVQGKKMMLLGDMLELGSKEKKSHLKIGEQAAATVEALFLYGTLAKEMEKGARKAGLSEVYFAETHDEAASKIKSYIQAGDILWVKGSRGMKLEKIIEQMRQEE